MSALSAFACNSLNEERVHTTLSPSFSLAPSLSLSLWPVKRVQTPSSSVREIKRKREGGREGERDKERERKREGEGEIIVIFISKRNDRCLGTI
jgi:hypothetical protein